MRQIDGQLSIFDFIPEPEDPNEWRLPCDTCKYDVKGCCAYDFPLGDFCRLGDKWEPKTVTMFGKEWHPLDDKPEDITEYDQLEILGTYTWDNKEKWSCCPACLEKGQIIALDVPWDIPRPKWKYWRLKEKVYPVDIMGLCDDAYCPKCGRELDDLRIKDCERCPDCHVRIDWTPWHRANDPEEGE